MAYELTLHDLGEGLTEAEVIAWLVAVGEPVRVGDALVEVETAKTTAEITAPRDGILLHQGAAPGATLAVGRLLAVIGDPGESWSPQDVTTTVAPGSSPAPATAAAPSTEVTVEVVKYTMGNNTFRGMLYVPAGLAAGEKPGPKLAIDAEW